MVPKSHSRKPRRALYLEVLEDRTVLSNVTAIQNPNTGVLTITGDNSDTGVNITEPVPNQFVVIGEAGTFVNGGPTATFNSVTGITVLFGNGNDTVGISAINIPGAINITEGTGNETVNIDMSTFRQADVTLGAETNGAVGSDTVTFSQDTITGNHLALSLLNESGLSGVRSGGAAGISPGAVNTVTMNNLQFTGGGNLNVRVDDGVAYNTSPGSSVTITQSTSTGNVSVNLGDHFQTVQLGTGTVDATDIKASNLGLSIGNDVDNVVATAEIKRSETVALGDVSTYVTSASELVNGTVGTSAKDSLTVAMGNNANTNLSSGWPLEVTEADKGGLSINAGNGDRIKVDPTSVGGVMQTTMGNGGVNDSESLQLLGVMCNDPQLNFNSKAGDTVHIDLSDVVVTGLGASLNVVDLGHGPDIVNLMNVQAAELFVFLSNSGHNVVTAQNVVVGFGIIFGGAGLGDQYIDHGGNHGYVVLGFP
jgi:hypothetical protein